MAPYIQSYVDVCTGKAKADENTKEHFKAMLKIEADKITPLVLECKEKGIDVNELCPELMQDWIEMVEALAVADIPYSYTTREHLNIILT